MEVNPEGAALQVHSAPVSPASETSRARRRNGRHWTSSREIGLALGILAGKRLFNIKHLHYGIWPKDLAVKLSNLGTAQQHFTNFLLKHIPPGVSSILDIGCGTGALASELLARGYSVDCVCPNPILVRHARKHLKNRCRIYPCIFEALETDRRYDLFLFSESFQYIKTYKGLEKTLQLRRPGSLILICDFFKTDAPGECVIGGGPNLRQFHDLVAAYGCFKKLNDIDITERTAPTTDLVNNALKPATALWKGLRRLSGGPRSRLLSLFGKDFAARVEKLERKYFSGLRTAQHFSTFKSYRLLLYRICCSLPACDTWVLG